MMGAKRERKKEKEKGGGEGGNTRIQIKFIKSCYSNFSENHGFANPMLHVIVVKPSSDTFRCHAAKMENRMKEKP